MDQLLARRWVLCLRRVFAAETLPRRWLSPSCGVCVGRESLGASQGPSLSGCTVGVESMKCSSLKSSASAAAVLPSVVVSLRRLLQNVIRRFCFLRVPPARGCVYSPGRDSLFSDELRCSVPLSPSASGPTCSPGGSQSPPAPEPRAPPCARLEQENHRSVTETLRHHLTYCHLILTTVLR